MAITYVGGASTFATANPLNVAYTATGGSGSVIVVWVTYNANGSGPGTIISSVTDSAGNTYTAIAAEFGTTFCAGRMFYAKNPTGGSLTIHVNYTSTQTGTVSVTEFAGTDPTSPLGVSGNHSGTSSPQTATFTACNASDVLVGGVGVYDNGTFTAGSPSMTIPTGVTAGTGGGNSRGTTEYSIAPGVSTSATIAYSSAVDGLILQVAAFIASGGGGGGSSPVSDNLFVRQAVPRASYY